MGRCRAADGRDVVDQGAVHLVTDSAYDRKAQERDRAAQVLVAERPQVGERAAAPAHHRDLDLLELRQPAKRRCDPRRRAAVLHRRVRPHDRPAPAAALEASQEVLARRAPARGDDADRLRKHGAGELLLRLEEAVALELLAKRREPRQQVAVAGQAHVGRAEVERGRGVGRARVVVEPAADHDLGAVGEELLGSRPSFSRSVFQIEQGSAPWESRSSKNVWTRERRKPVSSPVTSTFSRPRRNSLSRSA